MSKAKKSNGLSITQMPVESLVPYARNARTHSPEQVRQLADSIREFGFTNPVLIDGENEIIAGHGRVLAAQQLGMSSVPCIQLTHLTEVQKRAYVIADNKLALNAGWDEALLRSELDALADMKFDLDVIGFDESEISALLGAVDPGIPGAGTEPANPYTGKIISPVYTPRGDEPPIFELFDRTKTAALIAEIDAADLPAEVAHFLRLAAERHTVFYFGKIAEFYCHADAAVQDLMERSAPIIIDFNKAVEYGFVHLTEVLGKIADYEEQRAEEDGA